MNPSLPAVSLSGISIYHCLTSAKYLCVDVLICVSSHTSVNVHMEARGILGVISRTMPYFLRQGISLAWSSSIRLD